MRPPPTHSLPQPSPQQVDVEFFSGPNLVAYQYNVACYLQDSVTCGDVIGGGLPPIDSVNGSLPRGYSRVVATMTVRDCKLSIDIPWITDRHWRVAYLPPNAAHWSNITPQIPDNTDVDCFVTVGGGPLDLVSKCQLAGEATTDPAPVRGHCHRMTDSTLSYFLMNNSFESTTSRALTANSLRIIPFRFPRITRSPCPAFRAGRTLCLSRRSLLPRATRCRNPFSRRMRSRLRGSTK